ncbi:MAG: NYN domain-containing protein [Methylotenera sp.]|nr:NYN domain-containing protein [Methylotenera sp.]MDO9389533.1 NYN domain-containing protein [Methylotenera sp.]
MNTDKSNPRLAVLIDADNARANIIEGLLAEVVKFGVASVKRIYGDWTTPNLGQWKTVLLEHSIQPIQQFRYTTGKNATDSAMIIDAMDLLYTDTFDGFCIISSDSDFTRLASRIRESGKRVYGFGEKKTPRPFVTACDRFIYTENLLISSDNLPDGNQPAIIIEKKSVELKAGAKKPVIDNKVTAKVPKKYTEQELKQDTALMNLIRKAIDVIADESGMADLSGLGNYISKQAPDFDSRNYGYERLSLLIEAMHYFDISKAGHKVFVKNVKK